MLYVDFLLSCIPKGRFRWTKSCHLFCEVGDLDSLHTLAIKVGLKRQWFQNKAGKMPHYDLHEKRRIKAIELGAKELNRKDTVRVLKEWKALYKSKN